jgi:hypothetical protein
MDDGDSSSAPRHVRAAAPSPPPADVRLRNVVSAVAAADVRRRSVVSAVAADVRLRNVVSAVAADVRRRKSPEFISQISRVGRAYSRAALF